MGRCGTAANSSTIGGRSGRQCTVESGEKAHRRGVSKFTWRVCCVLFTAVRVSVYRANAFLYSVDSNKKRFRKINKASTFDSAVGSDHTPKDEKRSSFWYAVVSNCTQQESILPSDHNLDQNGLLPQGAYFTHNCLTNLRTDPKATCRISLALNLLDAQNDDELEPHTIVSNIQKFVDDGLTSFHLFSHPHNFQRWCESNILNQFMKSSPQYQVDRCQFTVPLLLPNDVDSMSIRSILLGSLKRIGTEAIDCVQLQYKPTSMYHLDALDCLNDLQREGYVRSVVGANLPSHIVKMARDSGFILDTNQMECNLLDPTRYLTQNNDDLPLVVSRPLAGGFLTEKYGAVASPPRKLANAGERYHYKTTLRNWKERYAEAAFHYERARDSYDTSPRIPIPQAVWPAYQSIALATVQSIARKYGVSVASVALRWSLQLDNVVGATVACRLDKEPVYSRKRISELREVFTFSLEEEDMESLWQLSGCQSPSQAAALGVATEEMDTDERMERDASGLFLPSTRKDERRQFFF